MAVSFDSTKTLSGNGILILDRSAVPVLCPADTTEDILATITIPAGAMGANGRIRITHEWSWTNDANAKTCKVRFGGAAGTAYHSSSLTTQTPMKVTTEIANRNSASSQFGSSLVLFGVTGITSLTTTSAVDTTAATTIVITGQKAASGDTLTLESYLVELMYAG
jgi:hypothetical protein